MSVQFLVSRYLGELKMGKVLLELAVLLIFDKSQLKRLLNKRIWI